MAEQFANNAATTLSGNGGSITSGATSLIVASASQFPTSGNFRIIIGSEIIIVGAVSGTTFSSLTRGAENTTAASHNDGDAVTCILTAGSIAAILSALTPQGRLTLTSGTPFLSSSVTAATTVYYTPAVGDWVKLYDGSSWGIFQFTELSQATTDTSKSPAACAASSNYDVFVWNDSGTIRATRGPLWTSDTARGTGAGTTELTLLNGTLVNANAITNGPGANKGTYVGSFRTNGSSQVDMIFGGVGAAGGEGTILGVWNMYNRRFVALANFDNTDSWNYTTASFRIKNNNNNNKISFIIGWKGDGIQAMNSGTYNNSTTSVGARIGIGLNSTTNIATGSSIGFARNSSANGRMPCGSSFYSSSAPLGFNYVAPLEFSTATGTGTFYGDDGGGATGGSDSSTFIFSTMG